MNPSILPVMGYSVEAHNLSPIELKQLALFTVKPFLSRWRASLKLRIIGGKSKEYWLELDAQNGSLSLLLMPLPVPLGQTNFVKSNGYLADYKHLYLTVTDATLTNIDELKRPCYQQ